MGTVRATQLCWVILGFLLLQGAFNLSLSTESTPNTAAPEKASQVPTVASKTGTPKLSNMDGHSQISSHLTPPQPQQHISEFATSQSVTTKSATMSLRTREDPAILPSPTSETVLTVAAFGVISFIVILVVVVIILVSVVSLRFKCRKNKEPEDPQKPGSSGLSESSSTAIGEKDSITLISMKNINMNNSKGCRSAEKVL
ncbi:endothelial cell-specific chemotaxis regulator isoform X2 [Pteronotus mesoamericanus]|uniref:endothelial cell-specific chemotaxis regulator isoform X2 n=1 Tax=Pteronotus mesoamericanus TaxID=1884717 RepID=UPI0023EDC812|nr:endothelial cell-specific chemotaxis regulator isoform X2 [Pteronotus parnellii mesoamericanus]